MSIDINGKQLRKGNLVKIKIDDPVSPWFRFNGMFGVIIRTKCNEVYVDIINIDKRWFDVKNIERVKVKI